MRLLDAICEDLGVPRPPVRMTREIWVTTSRAEARRVAEHLANYHVVQWNLHQNTAPTVGWLHGGRTPAEGIRDLA